MENGNIFETANSGVKRIKIWDSVGISRTYVGCLWPASVKGVLGSLSAPLSKKKMACNFKAVEQNVLNFETRWILAEHV